MRGQRRGRSIAMAPTEIDAFLSSERTCRVGTVSGDGRPHVAPLWFVWDRPHLWLYSIVKSQRWVDISCNPNVAVVVDAGTDYEELRGVEIIGSAEVFGDVPRGDAFDDELREPERLFARKYLGSDDFVPDGRHGWLRVAPGKLTSWDFRKLAYRARDAGGSSRGGGL